MRIAISIAPLHSGHKLRGVGSYTKELIGALQKYEKDHSYSFFTRVQEIPQNADIVHYPFFDPFFLTLPLMKLTPTVVTVHDLIPVSFPQHFKPGTRGKVKWHIQRSSLQGTRAVITDSYASKQDIVRLAKISPGCIHVIPLAPGSQFQPVTKSLVLHSVKEKYKLPDEFLLYVGDVNWNKNVPGLIKAFDKIKNQKSKIKDKDQKLKIENLKLVLVGKAFVETGLEESVEISQLINSLKLDDEVIKLGQVAEEDLPAVYSLASVYTQPSFAEGFGLPILEAMVCGCPVVAANSSSIPEIAGPARMVDPEDPGAIAEAILGVLALVPAERKELVDKGFSWVKQFSWQRVAYETTAVYEAVFQK